jgi:hypothetical protein
VRGGRRAELRRHAGGSTFGVHTDDAYWTDKVHAPSLMSQLEATGSSWKGYYQNMPYPGYRGYCYPVRCLGVPDSDTLYIAKHNGIPYFDSINQHPSELAKMLPLPRLEQDLSTGRVANFNYVIPDECTDMHGAPPVCVDSGNAGDVNDNRLVSTADQFVGNLVQGITTSGRWSKGNNAVVVSAASARDVWAVGNFYTDANPNLFRNLGVHWDGSRWTAVALPNAGLGENTLFGVSALPSGGAWAAGYFADDAFRIRSLIERRNGSSWSIVPSPDPGSSRDPLFGVAALSDRDVWAVGGSQDSVEGPFHTLVEHWDGTTWRVADSPTSSSESYDPYAAVGGTWAVGDRESDQSPQRTLGLNLATGQAATTPDVGAGENDLYAATAKGGAVWAAGRVTDRANDHTSTLVERLHAGSWAVVPTPNPGGNSVASGFGGVTATSPAAAWAVGSTNDGVTRNRTLIEHTC